MCKCFSVTYIKQTLEIGKALSRSLLNSHYFCSSDSKQARIQQKHQHWNHVCDSAASNCCSWRLVQTDADEWSSSTRYSSPLYIQAAAFHVDPRSLEEEEGEEHRRMRRRRRRPPEWKWSWRAKVTMINRFMLIVTNKGQLALIRTKCSAAISLFYTHLRLVFLAFANSHQ